MIHLLLLLSLFHPSHHNQVVKDTLTKLKHAAAVVGNYTPLSHADDMYVTRAETDIAVAVATLNRYRHYHVSEQDVRTVVSQLERDLEDTPPAPAPLPDKRHKA